MPRKVSGPQQRQAAYCSKCGVLNVLNLNRSDEEGRSYEGICVGDEDSRKGCGTKIVFLVKSAQSTLQGKKVRVSNPIAVNAIATGVIGTAYVAVPDVKELYILDPEDSADFEIVGDLFFTESELEEC